jgi:hypothetical protein
MEQPQKLTYYQRNRERLRQKSLEYYHANREKYATYFQTYYDTVLKQRRQNERKSRQKPVSQKTENKICSLPPVTVDFGYVWR